MRACGPSGRTADLSMALNERLRHLFQRENVRYQILPHPEAVTASEIAAATHVSGKSLAKVVMVRDENGALRMAVVPAAMRVDLPALARAMGVDTIDFAREEEFAPLFPDCEIGAMPPFGNLYDIPVFADDSFARRNDFHFQAGNHHELATIDYRDFERLARPTLGPFGYLPLTPIDVEAEAAHPEY